MSVGATGSVTQDQRLSNLETQADPLPPIFLSGTTDAIPITEGLVVVSSSSPDAMTLALPKAGPRVTGGDDGKILQVASISAQAHTITTPSNGIYAAKHIATFGGAIGDFAEFEAFQGQWILKANKGCTIT